jgi:hypothetical protein
MIRVLAALALLALVEAARADISPPPRRPSRPAGRKQVKLVVKVDRKVRKPRLVVPRKFIGTRGRPRAEAAPSRLPTLAAGVALSLTVVTGGIWLVRRGKKGRFLAGALLAVSLVGLGGAALWADIPPLGKRRPPAARTETVALPAGIQLSDELTLEIVERGNVVTLIVPPDSVLETPASR